MGRSQLGHRCIVDTYLSDSGPRVTVFARSDAAATIFVFISPRDLARLLAIAATIRERRLFDDSYIMDSSQPLKAHKEAAVCFVLLYSLEGPPSSRYSAQVGIFSRVT